MSGRWPLDVERSYAGEPCAREERRDAVGVGRQSLHAPRPAECVRMAKNYDAIDAGYREVQALFDERKKKREELSHNRWSSESVEDAQALLAAAQALEVLRTSDKRSSTST